MKYKRIFIVGHSGAGKGLLATEVANKLNWQFIDSDFSLAASIGKNTSEIIGKQGEELFCNTLHEILKYQLSKENIVVTTDDSIVCDPKNRKLLANELVVYLKVSTQVQLERMGNNRPLLPMTDYMKFLNSLHHDRDAAFEEVAKLTLNSDDNALYEHVDTVVKAIK